MCPRSPFPPNESPQRRKWLKCPIWGHFLVKQTWFVYKSENRFTYRECDWLLQLWFLFGSYSHLSCSKSRLRTWSSSSQKDQLLRGSQGIEGLGLRRLSGTFQGPSWVSERSEGHVVKSFYSSCLLKGTRHEQLQTKYHHAQDYHAIGSHYRPCKNWQFSGSMKCNFNHFNLQFSSNAWQGTIASQANETSFWNETLDRSCFQAQVCPASVASLSCPH